MDPSSSTQQCIYVSPTGENFTLPKIDDLLKSNKKWPYKSNSSYPHQDSPLHHACRTHQKEITLFFLEKMKSELPENADGESIVHLACCYGDIDIIRKTLERCPKSKGLDTKNREGMTPLAILVSKAHLVGIQMLMAELPSKVKLDPTDPQNPLSIATEMKALEIIQSLLTTHNFVSKSKSTRSTTYKIIEATFSYYNSSLLNYCLDSGLQWKHLLKNHPFILHDIVKWRDLGLIKKAYAFLETFDELLKLHLNAYDNKGEKILKVLCKELAKDSVVTSQDKEIIAFFLEKGYGIDNVEKTFISTTIQSGQNVFLRKLFLEEPLYNYVDPLPTLSEADQQVILQEQHILQGSYQ